jgi:hypothetical protein
MKTTIFYENSAGFISQWVGEILETTETTITIKFNGGKAYRFDLKLNSGFMVVTKKKIKDLGVSIDKVSSAFSQDDNLREYIKKSVVGNIAMVWNGNKFE